MSYAITFFDKSEVIVDSAKGEKLKEAITGSNPPEHITLNGNVYKVSQITSITASSALPNVQDAIKAFEAQPDKQLAEGPQYICGSNSLQLQIIRYAHERKEIRKLKDPSYRDKVRQALLKKYPGKYCDYKTGNHVCIDNPSPLKQPVQSMLYSD